MSSIVPDAIADRSAYGASLPSAKANRRFLNIVRTSNRPSGSTPVPHGVSSKLACSRASPAGETLSNVRAMQSTNHSRPSCQRGPS
jgi:hypothetical protein